MHSHWNTLQKVRNKFYFSKNLIQSLTGNRLYYRGSAKIGIINNASQTISSPYFPYNYPIDLTTEYIINCDSVEKCRIYLIFTDFQIAESSILEVANRLKPIIRSIFVKFY